jgi:hypothetical protein
VRNGDETGVDCGGSCAPCPPSCTPITWEAETAFHSTGSAVTGGWNLSGNGYLEIGGTVTTPSTTATLVVTARGTVVANVWPRMTVSLGSITLGTIFVNSTVWTPYRFSVPASASGLLRVSFDNDERRGNKDRDLFVDKLALECGVPSCPGAASYEAESMLRTGGAAVTDGWALLSNGHVRTNHTFVAGRVRITVIARGSVAGGVWPNMVVRVGGVVVGTAAVNTTSWAPYVFDFTWPSGTAEIRVEFTNNAVIGSEDRDLYLDKVIVGCP